MNVFMSEWLRLLGGFALASTLILAAAAWLIRSLITYALSRDIEIYKTQLKAQSDLEIERLKDDLKRSAFEREIRFGKLHSEVFGAIKAVYAPMIKLHRSVASYLSPMEWAGEPSKDEKLKEVIENSKGLQDCYDGVRILLPKHIYSGLDTLLKDLALSTNNFTRGIQRDQKGYIHPEDQDPWTLAIKAVQERLQPMFDKMNDEMQEIMGFPEYLNKREERHV